MYKRIQILVVVVIWASLAFAQSAVNTSSVEQDLASLKELDGSEYLKQSIEYAVKHLRFNDPQSTEVFLKRLRKKAKRIGGKSTVAAVYLEFIDKSSRCCWNQAENKPVILKAINTIIDNDRKRLLKDKLIDHLSYLNQETKDPKVIAEIYDLVLSYTNDKNIADGFRSSHGAILEAKQLETQKLLISGQNDQLAKSLRNKESQISQLSLAKARQALLLEHQSKVLDSIRYQKVIDSIDAQAKKTKIAHQESIIALQESQLALEKSNKLTYQIIILGIIGTFLLLAWFFLKSRKYNSTLQNQNQLIAKEQKRSESLLLNILPKNIAFELKNSGFVKPKHYKQGTVLFTDFVGFSRISREISVDQLIEDLDHCFAEFDRLAEEFGVEKIKTIGDAYMCVSGVPTPSDEAPQLMVKFGMAMQDFLETWNEQRAQKALPAFEARIGIHTGPVVAGVVGRKKFAYDVWGDTVNIAARMESNSEPGKVNLSETTYQIVKEDFKFESRGSVEAKNIGKLKMYFVNRAS